MIGDMEKRYALFDWDNTVRRGYTLYSWVDYLCDCHVIDSSIQSYLNEIRIEYKSGLITHDEYAQKACEVYSHSLKGISSKKIEILRDDYLKIDEQYIYNDIKKIFELLNKEKFDIIIISGAPTMIIEKYKKRFHFKHICAFKEKVIKGQFNGEVEYNYGFDKETQVLKFIKQYDYRPYMSFGDSSSDIPLLNYAYYPFFLGKENLSNNYKLVTPNNVFDRVKKILKSSTPHF